MFARLLRLFGVLLVVSAIALAFSRAPDLPVQSLVARWAPPPSDFIDVKGQLVHLRDEGPRHDPLPLVLIHGTSSSLHTWQGWARELRGQRRVISFETPAGRRWSAGRSAGPVLGGEAGGRSRRRRRSRPSCGPRRR
jgi:hypothetical protein